MGSMTVIIVLGPELVRRMQNEEAVVGRGGGEVFERSCSFHRFPPSLLCVFIVNLKKIR
jgi:hypothetical protein